MTEPEPQLNSLNIRPLKGEIRLAVVILVFQLCFQPFLWLMPEEQVPEVFLWSFRFLLFWIIFEMIVMLSKPISLSVEGNCLEVNYLLSPMRRFSFADIRGYSTLQYATRGGIRNSVVFYLHQGQTFEISEHVVSDVSKLVSWLENKDVHHFGTERSSALTCFPFRKYKHTPIN